MNTSISDMASFPIPPLGSHWFHESDLIGDLFDLTICIIIFRCPTDGISISFSTFRMRLFLKCTNWFRNIYMHVGR